MKKLKVAILLSGHVRSYKQTYKNFEDTFINNLISSGHSYDVYISTWDVNGKKVGGGGQSGKLTNQKLSNSVMNDLKMLYSPVSIEIEESNGYEFVDFEVVKILDNYPKLKNLKIDWDIRQHIHGVLCQLYKIKKSYMLIGDPEDYDIIIKHRFDIYSEDVVDWEDKIFLDNISQGLYLKTKNKVMPDGTINWGDGIVMGPPLLMKYFCLAYDYIIDENRKLQLRKDKDGDLDYFSITHIVNSIFKKEGLFDKLNLHTKEDYVPFNYTFVR